MVVTKLGTSTVRVQTEKLSADETEAGKAKLAKAFGVPEESITSSFVGASWGSSVSDKARNALVVFLILVSLVLAAYFRTWKMSLAALIALVHDLVITVGIYALAGFEITPASVIGFLTILGYSLYDTVVVFDKVRENTSEAVANGRMSYSQAANLAVNQTLVRSINTSVVALLPVAAILVVGFTVLGPGTLLDLSLALFVGIAVGTYSSIFIATPILADLREREPAMQAAAQAGRALPGDPRPGRPGGRGRARPARRGHRHPGGPSPGRRTRRPCRGHAARVHRPAGAPLRPVRTAQPAPASPQVQAIGGTSPDE